MIKYININKDIINKYKHINIIMNVNKLGGFYAKYLKYKAKYIALKKLKNF
jgi:hypothetical protein